ncbi:MAG: hypothetical protein GYA33_02390 [Thermogutta sp.]|nr:hypothetical protein [Thermogutta sp.]
MEWLFEDPTYLYVGLLIVVAILGGMYVSTVKKEFLWAAAGAAGLIGLVYLADYLVVTDREAVQETIDAGIAALEANDLYSVLDLLAPSAEAARRLASWGLDQIRITRVNVSGVKITIRRDASPPTAEARFFAVCRYVDKSGSNAYEAYAANFRVVFEKVDDRWLLTDDYEWHRAGL